MFIIRKKVVFLQPHFERDGHRGVAQLASALAWGARGRKFESFRPDTMKKELQNSFFLFPPHNNNTTSTLSLKIH